MLQALGFRVVVHTKALGALGRARFKGVLGVGRPLS